MWKFSDYAGRLAAIDESDKITYSELQQQGDLLAEQANGRCLVFCLCTNTIPSLIGYTGFINNNIVPLLLDSNLNEDLLQNLIETYSPMYLWGPEEKTEVLSKETIYHYGNYQLVRINNSSCELFSELGLLLTTSGSTGSPKLVRQSYKNISSNAESIAEYLELTENERPITTLPMNYTYGLSIINSHLLVGATLIMTDKSLMQKEFWHFFKKNNATSIAGVPYTYEILKRLRFFKMELPSLRYMTQAGGKLSPELHKEFAEYAENHGKRFYVMYGQTEATARMSYLPYQKSLEKYGSMGVAIPGGRFSLIDADGSEIVESETMGELVYAGENVTLGYAEHREDLKKGDENNGVLVTGDMAKMDSEGYYYIVGRKKRFLKIFGNRVNLDETERLIRSRFDCDCACTGVDDRMMVFITNNELNKDIKIFLSEKTGLNSSAFEVIAIPEVPKNEAGKTLYSAINDRRSEGND